LAQRIHNRVLQLVGSALLKAELCEQLGTLGRAEDIPPTLAELRSVLEDTCLELRSIMAELRVSKRADESSAPLHDLAA
jgi:hypothetical protein